MHPVGTKAWILGSTTEYHIGSVPPHHADHSSPCCDQSQFSVQTRRFSSTLPMAASPSSRWVQVRASEHQRFVPCTVLAVDGDGGERVDDPPGADAWRDVDDRALVPQQVVVD